MLETYNKYSKRQENVKFKEKFFEFVMFLKSFYKEHLREKQTYIVQGNATGAQEAREFSIQDYSKIMPSGSYYNEWQFRISYFISAYEEKDNRMEMTFTDKSTNEYTKALEEIIKEYSYKTKIYSSGLGYYIKKDEVDNIILKIKTDIDQYVDAKKYNL